MGRGLECCFSSAGENVWVLDASVDRLMVSVPYMFFVDVSIFVVVVLFSRSNNIFEGIR